MDICERRTYGDHIQVGVLFKECTTLQSAVYGFNNHRLRETRLEQVGYVIV